MRKIALFLILFFLFACSSSPSGSLGKNVLLSDVYCRDCININFKKTNGIKDGIHYQMYFDAEIIFLKDAKSVGSQSTKIMFSTIMPRDFQETYSWMVLFDKGDKYHLSGIIYFINTEKGWLPTKEHLNLDEFKKI
jgi:hypothetical protein